MAQHIDINPNLHRNAPAAAPAPKRKRNNRSSPSHNGACFCVCASVAVPLLVIGIFGGTGFVRLSSEQQVVLSTFSGKTVQSGPGTVQYNPFTTTSAVRSATLVAEEKYVHLKDTQTGAQRSVAGPTLLFLGAYETMATITDKVVLRKTEYVLVLDRVSGVQRVVRGPTSLVPEPTEQVIGASKTSTGSREAIRLRKNQYVEENEERESGRRRRGEERRCMTCCVCCTITVYCVVCGVRWCAVRSSVRCGAAVRCGACCGVYRACC